MSLQVNEEVDLVIVGGGPTGLLCAVLARQLGLSISVIDEKPACLQVGRADGLNARTQQYLEVAGTLRNLLPKGIKCNTSSTFAHGKFQSRKSAWWTSLEHCHHKSFLIVGQAEVEKALLNQLDDDDAPPIVRFGKRVASVVEDADGVTVTTEIGNWTTTTRAQFVIGADGARSTVRQGLGIGFHGTQPEMVWAVLDTFLDTDFPVCTEIVSLQLGGQCSVLWIPRERGMSRFYVRVLEKGRRDITQAEAEEMIREHMAPYRVDFVHTEWFSHFEVKERIASSFASQDGRGRIALAGDAAHAHSVNGAQGLNTGIADAFGLVWRIALALRKMKEIDADVDERENKNDDSNNNNKLAMIGDIMKTYDVERRTVAQVAINVAATLVRDTLHSAKQYVSTIEKNAGYVTGMGVAYDNIGSPLVVESERGIWKAGRRCPDLTLLSCPWSAEKSQQKEQRLYPMVRYGRFLVLVVGNESGDTVRDFQGRFGHVADILVLLPQDEVSPAATEDGNNSAVGMTDYLGISHLLFKSDVVTREGSFMVLVRPDTYIGYVGDRDGVLGYLSNILS